MNNKCEEEHEKTLGFYTKVRYFVWRSARVFSMFCVGRGNTVNSEVLAAQRKHDKTLCAKKIENTLFQQNCKCFIDVSCMVQNHRKYQYVISAKKTQ